MRPQAVGPQRRKAATTFTATNGTAPMAAGDHRPDRYGVAEVNEHGAGGGLRDGIVKRQPQQRGLAV
jgi:hypothetical protein